MHIDPAAPRAYVDESFRERPAGGTYVLAATVYEPSVQEDMRRLMVGLRGRRRVSKLHWKEMDQIQRKLAVEELATIDGFCLVVVGAPVPVRRQERARAACLAALVPELHGVGVEEMLIEARASELDRRDIVTVSGARLGLPKGAQLRVDHLPGSADPLLWSADIVAGAVRARCDGDPTFVEVLSAQICEVSVSTGC